MFQRNGALQLPALAEARNDRGKDQMLRIGMDVRIQLHAPGLHVGIDVSSAVDVNHAVDAKLSGSTGAGQLQPSNALWRGGIAGDGFNQPHVQLAPGFALPAGMGKVIEHPGDFQSMIRSGGGYGCDPQGTEVDPIAHQIERGLHRPMHRRRHSARQIQIGGSGLDAIALLPPHGRRPVRENPGNLSIGGNVYHEQRNVVGIKVQRGDPILKVEGRSAILEDHNSLLHRNVPRLHIEERIEGVLALLSGLARAGLIGRAVCVNDEVEPGPIHLQVTQQNVRTEEIEQAKARMYALDTGIGRFAGSFKPVNDQAAHISFQIEQMPVEGGDLDTPTSRLIQHCYQSLAD